MTRVNALSGGPQAVRRYAYTRVADPVPADAALIELMTMDVVELRRVARQLTRAANRLAWRSSMQRFASMFASALRAARASVGDRYAGQRKADGGWIVLAADGDGLVAALGVSAVKPRRWSDFLSPVRVHVLAPDLVDADLLAKRLRHTNRSAKQGGNKNMSCPAADAHGGLPGSLSLEVSSGS